jgi:hypothetical protein
VILGVLTGKAHPGTIDLANGVATVGTHNLNDALTPDVFGGLAWYWNGYFYRLGLRTDSNIAQRQGSSPPKPLGVFLLCHTVAGHHPIARTKPGCVVEKGTGMGAWYSAPGANP